MFGFLISLVAFPLRLFRANTRLRDESSQANQEISRLKALLKKEEITRSSLQEQLNQKTREIEELMKIWDELKTDA